MSLFYLRLLPFYILETWKISPLGNFRVQNLNQTEIQSFLLKKFELHVFGWNFFQFFLREQFHGTELLVGNG